MRDRLAATADVTHVEAYRQVDAVAADGPVFDLLRRGEIDAVALTSPNVARNFLAACDETVLGRLRGGQIGR